MLAFFFNTVSLTFELDMITGATHKRDKRSPVRFKVPEPGNIVISEIFYEGFNADQGIGERDIPR